MKKLFVTVGSTQFPELIDTILSTDFLTCIKNLGFSHLVVQAGSTRVPSVSFSDLKITTYTYKSSIIDDMKAAYMIISHAGSGSILEALSLDKKLLIVINSSLMDNHQSELANELCPDYLISTHITNLMSNFIKCYNRTPCKKWDSAEYTLLPIIKEELGL